MTANYEIIIVGAGVAGASLAIALARDGRRVLCLERSLYAPTKSNPSPTPEQQELHYVPGFQGEYLQPPGVAALSTLGLSSALDGIGAVTAHGMNLCREGKVVQFSYAGIPGNAHTTSRVFRNGNFIRRLRQLALTEQNISLRHAVVTRMVRDSATGRVTGVAFHDITGDGKKDSVEQTTMAPVTVLCDGSAGFLPHTTTKTATTTTAVARPQKLPAVDAYALELHAPIGDRPCANIVAQDEATVMLYPLAQDKTRCIVLYPPGTQSTHAHLSSRVARNLPKQLRAPFELALQTAPPAKQISHVRAVPGALPDDGMLVLGDALKVRNAFTGIGMSVALSDVVLVRDMFRELGPLFANANDESKTKAGATGAHDGVVRALNASLRRARAARTTPTDFLANSMYQIFGTTETEEKPTASESRLAALSDMRDATFAYLGSDRDIGSQMFALMSGLRPDRPLLILHILMMTAFIFWFFAKGPKGMSASGAFRGCRAVFTLVSLVTPTLLAEQFLPNFRLC